MNNNDLLRSLRYALRCDDAHTSHLIQLGGGNCTASQVAQFRAKDSDPEFAPCGADVVTCFLNGLILENRGPRNVNDANPGPNRAQRKRTNDASTSKSMLGESSANVRKHGSQISNNVVLKQLRIALSLRSDDVHAILKAGGSAMSASEVGALFRKPDARNYRQCGDQVLRQFIGGLVKRREQHSAQSTN